MASELKLPDLIRRYSPHTVGLVLVIMVVVLMVWLLGTPTEQAHHKKVIQQISLITLPPPPPPPEIKQEPPKQKEQVVEKQDKPVPDQSKAPDISKNLGLDANGSAGADGFGLMARKGGRGVVGGGYGALVVQEINSILTDDDKLRHSAYVLVLSLWISPTGMIEKYKIDKQLGDKETIAMVTSALTKMGSISEGPPLEVPQPIRIRIRSRI